MCYASSPRQKWAKLTILWPDRLDELMDAKPDLIQGSFDEWFTVRRDHKASGDVHLGFFFKSPDHESPDTETSLGFSTIDVSRMRIGEEQVGF